MTHLVKPYKIAAYNQAIALRKRGFSYSEIARICGVSVGTASKWLAALPGADLIVAENKRKAGKENASRLRLINKARNTELKKQYQEAERIALVEYQNYRTNPLFMAGLALYLSLGDLKSRRVLRVSDSRPLTHSLFIRFLGQFLAVEKQSIHFWLLLYPDLDEIVCMQYWAKKTGISVGSFYKNQLIEGRSRKKTLHFGVGNTIIGNTLLKKKLNLWIGEAKKEWS